MTGARLLFPVLLGLAAWLPAQAADLAKVPVRIVEGRLVVACDLSTKFRRLPVNLLIEYDTQCELQLHNKAAAGLMCEDSGGGTVPITIHLGGFQLTVPKREHGDEDFLDEFTRYHSHEMGENALVGTIGAQLLSRYFVVFDLQNGLVELGPARAESATARDPVEGMTVVPLTEVNALSWLPVRYQDGTPGALAIGGARYDTVVDTAVCERWNRPAGNIPSLRVADIELTRFVALRPERVVQVHPDGVCGVLGLGLLRHFRVEIDRVNRVARLQQTAEARYPEADLAFFQALVEEEADALQGYLERYPTERLSREAAERLLDLRLDEQGEAESCRLAIECLHRTYPADLRATAMADLMQTLVAARHPEEAIIAGRLGVPSGRKDRYPNSVHELHARLGRLLLDRGQGRDAWQHLLSAAFGLPEDGMINFDLGRYYEQEGRLQRAFSRYVQAVIKPDSGPAALAALHRLQGKMEGGSRMSVDRIEKLIAGKVHGFGAATVWRPTAAEATNRCALVEFFTNANLGDAERGGAIGGALGFDGVRSHFTGEQAAFITWHVDAPELVPMTTELGVRRAAALGVGPAVIVTNGVRKSPGAGKWRDKEEIYNRARRQVLAALQEPSEHRLAIRAEVRDDRLTGIVEVHGPERSGLVVQVVLVERGVLFPGKSEIVIHRNVARAGLTADPMGVPFRPQDGVMRLELDCSLQAVAAQNERHLDQLVAQGKGAVVKLSMAIDPEQAGVVAFVRDGRTGEVLQAAEVRATVVGKEDDR